MHVGDQRPCDFACPSFDDMRICYCKLFDDSHGAMQHFHVVSSPEGFGILFLAEEGCCTYCGYGSLLGQGQDNFFSHGLTENSIDWRARTGENSE